MNAIYEPLVTQTMKQGSCRSLRFAYNEATDRWNFVSDPTAPITRVPGHCRQRGPALQA